MTSQDESSLAGDVEETTTTVFDSVTTPSIESDYLMKFLTLGDSGVGMQCILFILFIEYN